MSEIDWTAVIISIFGGTGFIATIIVAVVQLKKPTEPKEVEDKAVERVSTPAAPGNDAYTVNGLISLANEVGVLSRKLAEQGAEIESQKQELGEVKRELGMFRRSYNALYWWSVNIVNEWEALRENVDPPELPPDIHHP